MKRLSGSGLAAMILAISGTALTFAPWSYSGSRGRSSYELVRSAERLLLLDDGYPSVAAVVWKAMPLLGAFIVAAVLFLSPMWSRICAALFGVLLGLAALAVVAAPAPLRSGWGAKAALGVGVLSALIAIIGSRGSLGRTVLEATTRAEPG